MKIYLVGGAVRDKLLGLPIKERDWVVVGATVDDMLNLGYRQVGKEFPVFLHPQTSEEYALARIEHKTKPGYKGFSFDTSPDVALTDDLQRRDLTINAMAETPEGELIDPFQGKQDLHNKILRHVSIAFAEDPVRILRIGRFLARYAQRGFHVAAETSELMQKMVAAGEVNALVAERVWKEFERALTEKNPEQFFTVLAECNALAILFPHLQIQGPGIQTLISVSQLSADAHIRLAALLYAYPEDQHDPAKKAIAALCQRYRLPNAYRELALLTANHYTTALQAKELSVDDLLQLFTALDIFRRAERYKKFLVVCQAIAHTKKINFDHAWLLAGAEIAKSIDVQALINQGFTGNKLAAKLTAARREKIAAWIKKSI